MSIMCIKISMHEDVKETELQSKILILTTEMDLGRIDNQTRPVNILVTAKLSVNKSALDCELKAQLSHM